MFVCVRVQAAAAADSAPATRERERKTDPLVVNPLELLPHLCTPFPLARVPPANLAHVQTVKEGEREVQTGTVSGRREH